MNRVLVGIPTILRSYTAGARVSFIPAVAGGARRRPRRMSRPARLT